MRALIFILLISTTPSSLWSQPVRPPGRLDVILPFIEVDGTWWHLARELHGFGIRVSIEDVRLAGMPLDEMKISIAAAWISVRDLLDLVQQQTPGLAWREVDGQETFRGCWTVVLYRAGTETAGKLNLLSLKIRELSFQWDKSPRNPLSRLRYLPEVQERINPLRLPNGEVSSMIGGTRSDDYKAELKPIFHFENAPLRDIVNAVACADPGNPGYYFFHDESRPYRKNFASGINWNSMPEALAP